MVRKRRVEWTFCSGFEGMDVNREGVDKLKS
jgi:hypothetical protein